MPFFKVRIPLFVATTITSTTSFFRLFLPSCATNTAMKQIPRRCTRSWPILAVDPSLIDNVAYMQATLPTSTNFFRK